MSIQSAVAHGDLGRRHHARRHAGLDLYRQPVPAQFGWRHRAQPGGGARAFAGRDRASVEHLLFRLRRRRKFRSAWRSTDSARGLCLVVGAAITVVGAVVFACGCEPRRSDLRPRTARAWERRARSDGPARGLCPAVSARSLRHARRHADRARHARDAARDRAARLFDRDDRLARKFSRRRSGHVSDRPADCARGQGRRCRPRAAGARRCARACPAFLRSCAPRRSDGCSSCTSWPIRPSGSSSASGAGPTSRTSTATASNSAAVSCSSRC